MRNGGEPDVLVRAPAAPDATRPPRDPAARPGRLFRKYLLLILTLITGALLASGGITVYFSYQEHKSALGDLQHEKAVAAASRIEQYLTQIIAQLAYAALPQLGDGDVEMRKLEFGKLLRQVPEVTDICQLNPQGLETLCVSRLGMDSVGSMKDRSDEPAFKECRRSRPWIGPVYFRKETEPYMTICVRTGGDRGPVTIADINLKFIWDVVSRIKIGDKGKAYAIDSKGYLVADPDIGLVLRKTNLAHLPHVKAALEAQPRESPSMLSQDLAGTPVLASFAPIESLKWFVFVEQPAAEVYSKLNASILRTGLLLLAGLVISALAALALARGMVRPIRTLSDGARRIGEGNLDQKIEVKTGDELEALANRFNRMSSQLKESYAGLERKVDERTHELQNALGQQTAISDILRVISSSPTDVQPVLDAVAERAAHLCGAPFAWVLLINGDKLDPAAEFAIEGAQMMTATAVPLRRTSITGRAALDRRTVHFPDVVPLLDSEFPDARANAEMAGIRAILAVPLIREGGAYGAIFTYRNEPGLFAPDQVALVETFARQAAIAIDNVRLFNETKEALDQQTAISEILRVISGSPTDVMPVLDAIAERAARLCEAAAASIYLIEGGQLRHLASQGTLPDATPTIEVLPIDRQSMSGRAVLEGHAIHVHDMLAEVADYPLSADLAHRFGHRTVLVVPLFREGQPFGTILLRRLEMRPFTEREIALLKTFGDQAAIAIENVRLFNETKEALEQQTATADVLKTISRTTFELDPVLETLIESATRLCKADKGAIYLRRGATYEYVAGYGATPDQVAFMHQHAIVPGSGSVVGAVAQTGQLVHLDDAQQDPSYTWQAAQTMFGFRSIFGVPMLREGVPIGVVTMWRREVRPFSQRERQLVATFADQAVIAIQNVRLLSETKEALDQQRASGEVLTTISSSIADTKPVFDKILESCERLFAGKLIGVNLVGEDGLLRIGAYHGPGREEFEKIFPAPVDEGTGTGRAIMRREVLHFPDIEHDDQVPAKMRHACTAIKIKAVIFAPMLWEGRGIGAVFVGRDTAGPFSEKDISLLRTFADQAVIAIQNARLFNETQEALDQQRASGEVLSAISSSIADTAPVFEAILDSCERLFAGRNVGINVLAPDGTLRLGAYHGPRREEFERLMGSMHADDSTGTGLAIRTRTVQHYPDMDAPDVPEKARMSSKVLGSKAVIFAPMLWEGQGLGVIWVARDFAGPFSDKDIALLKTFADQAVIAIQNARLFNETQEALDQQRASGEVLSAISSSIADTSPVFETILASCERLFEGKIGVIDLVGEDGLVHLGAYHGPRAESMREVYPHPADDTSGTGTAITTRNVVHYSGTNREAMPAPALAAFHAMGIKSCIGAPMLWEGKGIGAVWVGRDFAGPFSDKDIGLLKTFSEQAVIAIQNARLFREIQDKSRLLEIANQHKSDFLANMSHELRTPLNAIIGFSEVLLEHLFGELNEKQDDYLKDIHSSGRHLLALINDILDLSKIEAGRMELERSTFHLPTTLSDAMTFVRERALKHQIGLGLDVDPAVEDVVADERKVKQILVNLLTNAVKFTPDSGRVNLSVRREPGQVVIAVRDTGIGIAAKDHETVFEEFRQVGGPNINKPEGTGLGLPLARKFVELHGGRIWLDSAPGEGSTFTFTLPDPT